MFQKKYFHKMYYNCKHFLLYFQKMRLTQILGKLIRNLNKPYWNKRIWEIGYRGRPIASTPS